MGLLDRISARTVGQAMEARNSIDTWISEYLIPSQFNFGGNVYPYGGLNLNQTWIGGRAAEVSHDLPGYMAALRRCPPAFAAQMIRALVLSQVRFTFRNPPWHPSTPRRTFGTSALKPLETPWRNATTGELVGRMEWHAGMAGNAYVVRRPNRLRVLRPDWVAILYGSDLEPDDPAHAIDGDLIGYVYCNGGLHGPGRPVTLMPEDVAHWSPMPDPLNAGVGMSWLTPAIREIQADRLATEHKIKYFENGATPNLVVKGITAATPEQFQQIVTTLEEGHKGAANAYKTLYLTAGADATVVGSNLAELDLKGVQGASETRIAMLSRVHPTILAVAEGLAGSSLNAGNFGMARRIWADSWIYPTLQDLASSLAPMVRVPGDAELWFDPTDMPILREDGKAAAEIIQIQMAAISTGITGGFEPKSVIAAVKTGDPGLLKHTGMLSVQLQKPGAEETLEGSRSRIRRGRGTRRYNPDQPRDPGGKDGGRWVAAPSAAEAMSMAEALNELLEASEDGVAPEGADEVQAELEAWAQRRYGGTFAGLHVEVGSGDVHVLENGISVQGTIRDAGGAAVGAFGRSLLRDEDDVLYAVHDLLQLKSSVQGQGFSRAFNSHLKEWYRKGGVSRIELTANIDVGGYAWARAGYDFRDEEGKAAISARMFELIDDLIMKSTDEDNPQAAEYAALVDKVNEMIESGDPTPWEISELGRDLADQNGMWFGKQVLLGSYWEGVLWL